MDEGRIVAWHKREGDTVAAGEVLFEVETDKATMEVESPTAGTLRRILFPADATAPVATVIALISDTAEEAIPTDASLGTGLPKPSLPGGAQAPMGPGPTAGSLRAQGPLPLGPSEVQPLASSADGDRVRSSPAARKRAQELGVDLGEVRGTGPGGRVTLEDIDAAASASKTSPVASAGEKREPLSRMRRAIAERMTQSVREQPQFSISRDVDMTAANEKRKESGASYTDAIVAACAKALRDHPRLRSRIEDDTLVTSEQINVGIAVALPDGLIVPVLRDADRKGLGELARAREDLERSAHAGKLHADALTGGVLTVSNLGTLGVDRFTAIVNPPEAAILAVGRVSERVVAKDGSPTVRPIATLTLSVDHRVADGATAARYLSAVAELLERGTL